MRWLTGSETDRLDQQTHVHNLSKFNWIFHAFVSHRKREENISRHNCAIWTFAEFIFARVDIPNIERSVIKKTGVFFFYSKFLLYVLLLGSLWISINSTWKHHNEIYRGLKYTKRTMTKVITIVNCLCGSTKIYRGSSIHWRVLSNLLH